MATYEIIEKDLDAATITLHKLHMKEYSNYCDLDGVWYYRQIIRLKKAPEID